MLSSLVRKRRTHTWTHSCKRLNFLLGAAKTIGALVNSGWILNCISATTPPPVEGFGLWLNCTFDLRVQIKDGCYEHQLLLQVTPVHPLHPNVLLLLMITTFGIWLQRERRAVMDIGLTRAEREAFTRRDILVFFRGSCSPVRFAWGERAVNRGKLMRRDFRRQLANAGPDVRVECTGDRRELKEVKIYSFFPFHPASCLHPTASFLFPLHPHPAPCIKGAG
jgi:hypothetical protein